jgi:hypothetical protein
MFKKFLSLVAILTFITACGGGSGSTAAAASSSSSSSGGAAEGYQVPGSFQPVDSEN